MAYCQAYSLPIPPCQYIGPCSAVQGHHGATVMGVGPGNQKQVRLPLDMPFGESLLGLTWARVALSWRGHLRGWKQPPSNMALGVALCGCSWEPVAPSTGLHASVSW